MPCFPGGSPLSAEFCFNIHQLWRIVLSGSLPQEDSVSQGLVTLSFVHQPSPAGPLQKFLFRRLCLWRYAFQRRVVFQIVSFRMYTPGASFVFRMPVSNRLLSARKPPFREVYFQEDISLDRVSCQSDLYIQSFCLRRSPGSSGARCQFSVRDPHQTVTCSGQRY